MPDKIVHTIHLDRYAPMPAQIQLGTVESYGVEQIAVVAGAGWDGLDIVAVYHPPKAAEPVRVLVPSNGLSDVPPEATASAGRGALVIAGMADGVQIASCNISYTVIAQAGTDGTTSDAPTPDLVQQILSAANGAVKIADGVREDMDKVLEAESWRETAEAHRAAAESERVTAETARTEAEADRAAAEKERQTAESARIAAEDDRQSAETSRAKAETARESAETDRVEAEAARVNAEGERAYDERLRNGNETQRVTDEIVRQTAESKRQEAETARADADQSRVEAETDRVTSETARKDAESKRASAEQERQTAEQGRTEAETARVEAEAEREKQLPALSHSVDELWARQNILVGSETGNPVSCNDAYSAPLCGLTIYGKSTQDGTPTPDAPVPIVSAGDDGTVVVTLGDGGAKTKTITLSTPGGLPGIPVKSDGNYTDQNGQQWVCDEVDLERGVKVQRITTIVFSDNKNFDLRSTGTSTKYRFSIRIDGLKITDLRTADSSAFCSALALGTKDSTWNTPNTFTIGSDRIGSDVQLYVRFENINSLDELQQYLQRSPMSLTAILVTPIETPLTPAEIAAYKALTAYAPDTVVQASDGAGIKLEYQRDVNIVIKKFEDAIASMTTT